MNMKAGGDIPQFPFTHWSSVMAAGETASEDGQAALGKMPNRYRPALKAYLIEKFHRSEGQALDSFRRLVLEVVLTKAADR